MSTAEFDRQGSLIRQLQGALGGNRIVAGVVSSTGTVVQGSGFTAARNAAGDYTVTFTTPLSGAPVVHLTNGTDAVNVLPKLKNGVAPTASAFSVYTLTTAGANLDAQFHFIAIG